MEMDFKERSNELRIEGRWADLIECLEEEKKTTAGSQRHEILEELGSIYLDELNDPDLAFRSWEELTEEAKSDDIIEPYCNQIFEKHPSYEPAFLRLETILRFKGDTESLKRLASIYLDLAELNVEKTEEFLGYKKQAADVFQELNEFENAYLVLSSALRIETLESLFDGLEELSTKAGKVDDFVGLFSKELFKAPPDIATPFFKPLAMIAFRANLSDDAQTLFRLAAKAFPHDPEIPKMLNQIYRQSGEWDVAVIDLEHQLENAVDFAHQKELRDELKGVCASAAVANKGSIAASYFSKRAQLSLDQNDKDAAKSDWENALDKDPNYIPALNNLIANFGASSSSLDLIDRYGRLISQTDKEPNVLTAEVLKERLLDYIKLKKNEPSMSSMHRRHDLYRRIYEIDPSDFEMAFCYGVSLCEADMKENAFRVLKRVVENKAQLAQSQIAQLFSVAADSAQHQGEKGLAWEWIQESVSLDAKNIVAWRLYKDLSDEKAELGIQIESRENICEFSSDQNEKEKNQMELGDLWLTANRPDLAMAAFNKVLEIRPDSVSVLRKQLTILQDLKKWNPLIRVLEKLVDLEENSEKKSKYLYTIAILYRDELANMEGAVHFFNLSLDASPSFLKAFEGIDRIFTERRLWLELERAYRKMLARLTTESGQEDLTFLLFKNLGEVYRTRLNDIPNAVSAFETALKIRPSDEELRSILAQLYGNSGASDDIQKIRDVYLQNPRNVTTIESLFTAYLTIEQYDAAFCVASVLNAKNSPYQEGIDFYNRYLGSNIRVASKTFFPELLELMYHENLDRSVSSFMAIVSYAIRGPYGKVVKDWGVSEKDDVNLQNPKHRFSKMFAYVSNLVGPQPLTKLYLRSDHRVGLRNMFCDPPSVLVGSEILEPIDSRATAFKTAKILAGLRPELYLAHANFSVEHLNLFFLSALEFGLDRKSSTGKNGAAVFKCLKKLPKPLKMQLRSMALVLEKLPPPDLGRWVNEADLSSTRFAMLVCGDVETAVLGIRESQNAFVTTTPAQKNNDIFEFGMSENYIKVRAELGLSLF